jgi:RNA polymerase sigma-54 factor
MHLKPLKMQDIADRVGVHVSTVSRALAGKYVQTPRGVFPLKHFFTGGVEKEDGELESWEVVRQKLLQVVDNEDKSTPLSDEQIAEELSKQGIEIARRTVSKYRKVLAIPSSRRRREY